MSLLPSSVLCGGVRVGSSNANTTYTPGRRVVNQSVLDSIPDSEVSAWVTGINPESNFGLLVDDNVKFYISVNKPGLNRFGYSDSDRRWNSLPGGPPSNLGVMTNDNRLNVGTILEGYLSESPVSLVCGLPPLFSFRIEYVDTNSLFTDVPSQTVQVSRETGDLNFSRTDINNTLYAQQNIYWFSQFCNSFTDIGSQSVPVSSIDGDVYLRPIPGGLWNPRVSYGNRNDLEIVTTAPLPGQCQNLGGGHFRLNSVDLEAYANDILVYRGLTQGPKSPSRYLLGNSTALWPNVAINDPIFIGITDPAKYLFALKSGSNYFYLQTILVTEDPSFIPYNSPYAYVNTVNGKVFTRKKYGTGPITVVDCELDTGFGVCFVLSPSILNIGKIASYSDFSQWVNRTDYSVTDQIRGNRITLQDAVSESYPYSFVLANGASSGRTGRLLNLESTTSVGYGYVLNSINKSLLLGFRANESYSISGFSLKLNHSAYFNTNLVLTDENQNVINEDSYELDPNAGLITFTKSWGRGTNKITSYRNSILNNVVTINDFDLVNKNPSYCYVNSILYQIVSKSGNKLTVSGILPDSQDQKIDLFVDLYIAAKDSAQFSIIPPTNFHLYKSESQSGPFTEMPVDEYSVLEGNGQIRLNSSSEPDTFYRVTYQTLFNGSLISKEEFLNALITNEQCSPTNSPLVWTFNPDKRVLGSPGITNVVVKGSALGPNDYRVEGNTLYLPTDPLSQSVLISYNVLNYQGGKRTFQASSDNIVLNSPKFNVGLSVFSLPGNLTSEIGLNSILVFDDKSSWLVSDVGYDSKTLSTVVKINSSLDTNKNQSIGILNPVDPVYSISLDTKISVAVKTASILLPGKPTIRRNSILFIDNDPYIVSSTDYQPSSNRTKVNFYTSTVKNYSKASIRYTSIPTVIDGEINLSETPAPSTSIEIYSMGANSGVEVPSDKISLAGSNVKLGYEINHDLVLVSMESSLTPSFKTLNLLASRQILPDSINRISGQKLLGTYKIESPDSFYLRTYTYLSFAPEISSLASGGRITGNGNPSLTFQYDSLVLADLVLSALVKYFNDFVNLHESLREDFLGTPIGGGSYKIRYDGMMDNPKRDEYWQTTNHIDDDIYIRTQTRRLLFTVRRTKIYSKMYEYNRYSRFFRNAADVVVQVNADTNTPGAVIATTGFANITSNTTAKLVPSQARIKSRLDFNSFLVFNGDPNLDMPPVTTGQVVKYLNRANEEVGSLTVTVVSVIDADTGLSNITTSGGELISMSHNSGYLLSNVSNTEYETFRIDPESGDIITSGRFEFMSQVLFPEIPPNSYIRLGITYSANNTAINEIPVLSGGTYKDDGSYDSGGYLFPHEYELLSKESFLLGPANQIRFGTATVTAPNRITVELFGIYIGSKLYFMSGLNRGKTVTIKAFVSFGVYDVQESDLVTDSNASTIYSSDTDRIPGVITQYSNAVVSDIPLAIGSTVYFSTGPNANVRFVITSSVGNVYITNIKLTVTLTPRNLVRDSVGISVPALFSDYYDIYVNKSNAVATASNKYGSNAAILKLVKELSKSLGPVYKSGTFLVNGVNVTISGSAYIVPPNSFLVVDDGPNQGLYSIKTNTSNGFTIGEGGGFYAFPVSGSVNGSIYTLYDFLDVSNAMPVSKIWHETYSFWINTNQFYYDAPLTSFAARRDQISSRMVSIEAYWSLILDTLLSITNTYEVRRTWITQRADKINGIVSKKSQEAKSITNKLLTLRQDLLRKLVLDSL